MAEKLNLDGTQACRDVDVDIFFPDPVDEDAETVLRKTLAAKAICSTCNQVEPCLSYAIRNEPIGIWGGKTARERAQLRRKLKKYTV